MRKMRVAMLSLVVATGLGAIGWGVSASFTDSATATANINVGTFGIQLQSSTPGAVIDVSKHTITYTAPTILSSAPGSAALDFQVNNTGTIPATVTVVPTAPAAPFTDAFVSPGPQTIPAGGHYDYTGGLAWPALNNNQLGGTFTVSYTINATG